MNGLTHIDLAGTARMVDVGGKAETQRVAIARGMIRMTAATLEAIRAGDAPKGDVLSTARLAGIMAAKKTGELIPLCHPLGLDDCQIEITADAQRREIEVHCRAQVHGRTGVEMEALTGATVAALTIYDMAKAVDKAMVIHGVRLIEKRGGKSGDWRAPA